MEGRIPKLKKEGRLHALRRISSLGRITYEMLKFDGDSTVKRQVIARYMEAEVEAQKDPSPAMAITPQNYKFRYKALMEQGAVRRVGGGRPRLRPRRVVGDKGYSYPRIRRWCKRRQVEAVIPTRKDQPRDENFDKRTYKRRNIVERVVGWYKEYRNLGTRYEKLAVNYVAMWLVAMIDKALHRLLPDDD